MSYQGYFLPASSGSLYLACFGELRQRPVWLILPPFAEEMNLSRAVLARQARAFAARGEAAVLLDYFGCGDSAGEFEQARLATWQQDVADTVAWLQAQQVSRLSILGVRFGGLLALSCLDRLEAALTQLLLWKPVLDGGLMMTQFVRLKQVNEALRGGEKINWLARIAAGETHEIAGYPLTPALLAELQGLRLEHPLCVAVPPTLWLETGSAVPPLASAKAPLWPAGRLRQHAVSAPGFWQNPDIYDAPALIEQTLQLTRTMTEAPADVG